MLVTLFLVLLDIEDGFRVLCRGLNEPTPLYELVCDIGELVVGVAKRSAPRGVLHPWAVVDSFHVTVMVNGELGKVVSMRR